MNWTLFAAGFVGALIGWAASKLTYRVPALVSGLALMPRVLNKHTDIIPPDAIYVGRGRDSIWGNPFIMGLHGTREDVVFKYKNYVKNSPHLMARLRELKGHDLVCWCAPRLCHADVLLRLANEESS